MRVLFGLLDGDNSGKLDPKELEDGIVRTDAFTWTSAGEPLVVQSWLASLAYAVVEDLGGLGGVRLLMGLTAAGLAATASVASMSASSAEDASG